MSNLQQQYLDGVNFLDENYAYFLTHVLNIGKPKQVGFIPTAAVAIEKGKNMDDFTFLFNAKFAETLDTEEFAFVLAHETMHIVLNHLKLAQKDRFKDKKRFNVAADCVLNDYLVGMGFTPMKGLYYGKEVVGYNAAHSTVGEVYDDIPEDWVKNNMGKCDGNHTNDPSKAGGICDGSCGHYREIDSHDWMHDADADEQEAAEGASENNPHMPQDLDRTKKDDEFKSSLPPGSGVGSKEAFSEVEGVGLKWGKLLEKVNPFVFKGGPKPRATWAKPARKVAAMPETRLPVTLPGKTGIGTKKPAIVMALDTSSSIGYEQSNQFVNMARSVPQQHIKLFPCTFTTQYQPLDLDEPEWSSGGTAFDCIQGFIDDHVLPNNHRRYPTAVIVVTDGEADFDSRMPTGQDAKSWWWLMTGSRTTTWRGEALPGHIEQLNDFRK